MPEAILERLAQRYQKMPQPYWLVWLLYEALLLGAWLAEYRLLRRVRGQSGDPIGAAVTDRRYLPMWCLQFALLQFFPYRAGRWSSLFPHTWGVVALGATVAVAGIGIRLHSIRILRENFSYVVHVGDAHRLVTSGLYRWVRHPAYLGLLVFFAGVALLLTDFWTLVILMAYVGFSVFLRIRREERQMRERFGEDYECWRARTRYLIPFLL